MKLTLTNEMMLAPLAMARAYLPEADMALDWDVRDHDNDGVLDLGCRAPGGEWVWMPLPREHDPMFLQRTVQMAVDRLRLLARGIAPEGPF